MQVVPQIVEQFKAAEPGAILYNVVRGTVIVVPIQNNGVSIYTLYYTPVKQVTTYVTVHVDRHLLLRIILLPSRQAGVPAPVSIPFHARSTQTGSSQRASQGIMLALCTS